MATNESLVIGGIEQNSNVGDFVIIDGSLVMNPPKKRMEWATGADADGAALVRDPLFENRTIEYDLRVRGQSTTDGALAKIAVIVDLFEEAERQEDGLPAVWTPASGTRGITFRLLSGEITALPITRKGDGRGYFRAYPLFHVVLTLKPFGYGTEVVETAVTSSAPVVTATVAGVTGDVPAEGRLIVTDAAPQARRHVEWGLEQRHYDASTSLLIDSDSLVTTDFAGAGATRTGAYDPDATGNNVVSINLTPAPQAVCGLGNLSHVGTFRVKARVYASTDKPEQIHLRLAWKAGDASLSANPYVSPPVRNNFSEVDLGMVTVAESVLGTHRWTGQIEAYTDGTAGPLQIDYLVLVPAGEGYGLARGSFVYSPGVVNARDEFTGTTAGGSLNGRTAPTGGVWATAGGAGDFTFADGPDADEESATRSTVNEASRRLATLATSYAATEVAVRARMPSPWPAGPGELGDLANPPISGVVARFVDSANYLTAFVTYNELRVEHEVAGLTTTLYAVSLSVPYETWITVRLIVHPSGAFFVTVLDVNGAALHVGQGAASALATGGALASGRPGFMDRNPGEVTEARYYDNFSHATPAAEPITIHSGQSLEVRHNDTLREDSTGTYWGRPQSYRGSRFLVPPAGDENRTSRVLVKARRNDVESAADDQIADSTTVTVAYTPRFVAVPR